MCRRAARALVITAAMAFASAGCADRPAAAPSPSDAAAAAGSSTFENTKWTKLHSMRQELTVDLPDGNGWKVDDHSRPELVAIHGGTRSSLIVASWAETDLMNRAKCEARARERGLVPKGALTTVDDAAIEFPKGYDTRVWVALDPAHARADKTKSSATFGHVMAFGARIRQCMLFRFTSAVPGDDERALDALSSRLAIARTRILGQLTLDPPRIRTEATVPRESASEAPPIPHSP